MPDAKINGFQHHWEEAGSGEPFLLIHGAASSSWSLLPHMPELSKNFRTIMVDLRGMGRSERVPSIPPNGWEEDLGALLDHLGIESANLYGTSLGSRVVLRFTIDNPRRVRSLIIDNPIVANNPALDARFSTPPPPTPEAAARNEQIHGPDWQVAVQNYFNIRNDPAFQAHHSLGELSKGITVPTLITRGDSRTDLVHPLPDAITYFNNVQTSRLWIKPEGGMFATPEGYERARSFIAEASKEPARA
jgi:pimeloyl-ACP methyl ester carboxylesterase